MEIVNENGQYFIVIKIKDLYTKKTLTYKLKEFNVGELSQTKILPAKVEEDTLGRAIEPIVYLINAMIVEGEKISEKTPGHVLNQLKRELADFLF